MHPHFAFTEKMNTVTTEFKPLDSEAKRENCSAQMSTTKSGDRLQTWEVLSILEAGTGGRWIWDAGCEEFVFYRNLEDLKSGANPDMKALSSGTNKAMGETFGRDWRAEWRAAWE